MSGYQRMNIIFITSDQHRGDCYGFEGRHVSTPHLDDMARHGTRFAHCVTPSVVCQPARASILTGLLPMTHGVSDNGIDLPAAMGERGFAAALSTAGYRTGFIGKAHFASHLTFEPTGSPECRYSQANFGADWNGPYMGFQHVELIVEGHNNHPPFEPPAGQHYSRWYYGDGRGAERNALYSRDLGPSTGGAWETHYSALPVAWHNSTWIGDRTLEFIRRNHDRPFVVWASFPDPHHPFDCPEPWSRLHAPSAVDLPRARTRRLEDKPWWHRAYLEGVSSVGREDLRGLRIRPANEPPSDAQLRHIIANYYGMISLVDHQVGRIEALVSELGLAGDTLIVFTSDHGEWLGDHGLLQKGPMLYDGLMRVGMIAKGPGIPAGKIVADPVSTLDVTATLLDYGGVPATAPMHGATLRGLIEGGDTREHAWCEWDLGAGRRGVPLLLRAVRTVDAKLTVEMRSGDGEMYDLQADPLETRNVFHEPGYAGLRARLEAMLAARPDDAYASKPAYAGLA